MKTNKQTFYNEKLKLLNNPNMLLEKIEEKHHIKQAIFDLDNCLITIISEKNITAEAVDNFVTELLNQNLENDLVCKNEILNQEDINNIVTDEFNFINIDCPNCAAKVERALNKHNDIIDAEVNFLTKKIYIKHNNKYELYNIVSKIVKSVDKSAKISMDTNEKSEFNKLKPNMKFSSNHSHEHHEHNHECNCGHEHHEHNHECNCGHEHHHEHNHECNCGHEHHEHNHECNCGHEHHKHNDKVNVKTKKKISPSKDVKKDLQVGLTIFGVLLFFICTGFYLSGAKHPVITVCFALSYVLVSYDIIYKALWGLFHKDFFNESTLMVIASLGAMIIGEVIEAIMVILLFKVGELFQNLATNNSKNQIQKLMDLKVNKVTLKDGTRKNIKEVDVGEIVTVKVGERIPLDGIVKEGDTILDMKSLTGESIPVPTKEGEEILSGSINLSRVIDIEVTKRDNESTITKVLKLVEEASQKKSKSEKFITKFARIYTPCILLIAILVGIIQGVFFDIEIKDVFINVFTVLVISCPCALVISVPLGYFAGIGCASKYGILVKGGNYLEALTKLETLVFDKTGTITKGNFKVLSINPENGKTKEEILKIISYVEMYSTHPIAESIKKEYGKQLDNSVDHTNELIEELSGKGIRMIKEGKEIIVGNEELLKDFNIEFTICKEIGTIVYLAIDKEYCGNVVIGDEIKPEAYSLFKKLENSNYKKVMLSGDSKEVCDDISKKLRLNESYSKLLPNEKYEKLQDIISCKKGTVVYVGDGINDTPAIKLADVGIAMGALGSDSAKEASDIVIMNDDINKVHDAIKIAKYTKFIVVENIILALTIKLAALIIGILGILKSFGMIIAIFADVGICIIAILNVMRILKYKLKK